VGKDATVRYLRSGSDKQVQAGYSIRAITRTSIALSATTYATTDALYAGLTTNFDAAVDDGSYAATLRASSATELANVTASDPESSPPTVIEPPSGGGGGGGSDLSGGAIAGIVIGVLAGVAMIAFLYYFFVVSGAEGLLAGAREPPGGKEAQAARAARASKGPEPRSTSQISKASPVERGNEYTQENPVFKAGGKHEAKNAAAVFTGGPRNDML
jgi:hypothetical protein